MWKNLEEQLPWGKWVAAPRIAPRLEAMNEEAPNNCFNRMNRKLDRWEQSSNVKAISSNLMREAIMVTCQMGESRVHDDCHNHRRLFGHLTMFIIASPYPLTLTTFVSSFPPGPPAHLLNPGKQIHNNKTY